MRCRHRARSPLWSSSSTPLAPSPQSAERNHIEELEAWHPRRRAGVAQRGHAALRALARNAKTSRWGHRAFDHVEAGCELQHRSIAPDHVPGIAEIDRIIHSHTRTPPPLFGPFRRIARVRESPRTGTTLVERIIASHPAMSSVGENRAFATELQPRHEGARPPEWTRRMSAGVIPHAATALPRSWHVFVPSTKRCRIIFIAASCPAALPSARIIWSRSATVTWWSSHKAHFHRASSRFPHPQPISNCGLSGLSPPDPSGATLPPHVLLEINYEDIVRDRAPRQAGA